MLRSVRRSAVDPTGETAAGDAAGGTLFDRLGAASDGRLDYGLPFRWFVEMGAWNLAAMSFSSRRSVTVLREHLNGPRLRRRLRCWGSPR